MGTWDFAQWLAAAKQYGPLIAFFLAFIWWQAKHISTLLDKNSKIYEAEIERMAKVQEQLLATVLGPQPSSTGAPNLSRQQQPGSGIAASKQKEGG